MAFVNIHTNNLSRELNNSITYPDNYVFVPGTAITGDPDVFYTFDSLSDFQSACGTHGPEGSLSYEYVAGILSAGLPVIFKRIATNNINPEEVQTVQKASTEITHTDVETESPVSDIRILEKFGGTYGNNLSITIRNTGTAYYLDVYLNGITLVESKRLITYQTEEEPLEINKKLISALQTTEFDKITIDVLITEPEKFSLSQVSQQPLTGGTDLDESLVPAMLPQVYNELTDKILFSPKFITSGGYTDENPTVNTPIADAMKELTRKRQDCRALIDLPISTLKEEQQQTARLLTYQQTSNGQAIPSASTCAPWVYMQVGNKQLWMPPSFAYLTVVGDAVSRGGKSYTPKAGLSNGIIPNVIRTQFEIGSDIAEKWQADGDVNINPIMKLQGGSYVIAGNSTLLQLDEATNEENAFSESSADLTVIEIRRQAFNVATELQYQYNAVTAFETFSLRMAKLLDAMSTEGSVTRYDIENISTDDEPRKLKVRLDVYLTPTIKYIEIFLNISYGSVEIGTGGEA